MNWFTKSWDIVKEHLESVTPSPSDRVPDMTEALKDRVYQLYDHLDNPFSKQYTIIIYDVKDNWVKYDYLSHETMRPLDTTSFETMKLEEFNRLYKLTDYKLGEL
jgi:hypothetical protein